MGQTIWIKIHAYSTRLAYLSSLLPRYKAAKVVAILGKTSLVVQDKETGKLVNRHLSDCFVIKNTGNFSNLYTDSKTSCQQDVEEDFGGMELQDVPKVALGSADVAKLKNDEAQQEQTTEVQEWTGRLRKRERINYKD